MTNGNGINLVEEIGQPMYDGLILLRKKMKILGWSFYGVNQEMTNKSCIVIETRDTVGRMHWIQVNKFGVISPCVTNMRIK